MADAPVGGAGGPSALARGDFAAARAELERALTDAESPELHEQLARACLALDDVGAAQLHAETAYLRYREAAQPARAASAAMVVAAVHQWAGDEGAVGGWLARARRLVDEAGECVERGYLEVARFGCVVRDVDALEASAAAAIETARR